MVVIMMVMAVIMGVIVRVIMGVIMGMIVRVIMGVIMGMIVIWIVMLRAHGPIMAKSVHACKQSRYDEIY